MLLDKIKSDTVESMKAKDEVRLGTLRLLSAALHNREIEKRSTGKEEGLSDEEVLEVLRREVKKRREAIDLYIKGGRPELAKKEEDEVSVLAAYLPPALSAEELQRFVAEAVAELKPQGPKDFGKVMGAVMKKAGGRADSGAVSAAIKSALG